jgi:hypothetical protein
LGSFNQQQLTPLILRVHRALASWRCHLSHQKSLALTTIYRQTLLPETSQKTDHNYR